MNLKNKFIIFLILFINCQKIFIDVYPEINIQSKTINKDSYNEICYDIHTNNHLNIDTNKFVKAYSISRLFNSNIENKSGTLKDILKNGIEKRFSQDPVKIIFHHNTESCSNSILILIENYDFSWYPPQEFIQNPVPIRKGSFKAQFDAKYIIHFSHKQIEKQFSQNIVQNILPQKEYITIQNIISQLLKDFIDEIHKEYWLSQ